MLHSLAPLAAACQNRHLHASGGKVNRVPETRAACGWVVQDRGKRQDKRRERVSGVGWGDEGVVRLLRRDTRSAGGVGGGGNGEICFQRHLCLLRHHVQPLVPPHPISSVFGVSYPVKHCHLNFMGFVTRRRTLFALLSISRVQRLEAEENKIVLRGGGIDYRERCLG